MVKATPFLPTSNGGEFSPRMDARVDFDKYGSAISRGLNLICLPQGGVTTRAGSRFIKEVKTSTTLTTLMPFEPVANQPYMIETGDLYFRFMRNQGQIGVLTTPAALGTWVDRSTGTATAVNSGGIVTLTGAGTGISWAENPITAVVANQIHVVKFQLTGNPGSLATVQVGSASKTSDLGMSRNMGMGWHTMGFNPGANTTVFFQIINEAADILAAPNVALLSNAPIELPSPYSAAVVQALRWTQSGDVKYLFHDALPPYKLERRGDTSWSLVKAFFQDGPWLGVNPDTDLVKTNLIKNPAFSDGLGAQWQSAFTGAGYVNFNAVSNAVFLLCSVTGAATCNISQAVITNAIGKVHTIHFQVVGAAISGAGVGTSVGDVSLGNFGFTAPGWYTGTFTPTVSPFFVTFSSANQNVLVTPGVAGVYCYNTSARLLQPSGLTGLITVTALQDFKPFVATDIGRLLRIEYAGREPGWGVITGFTSSQNVQVLLYRDLPSTAPCESWRLGAWSDTTGWPHSATFFQQRLVTARTAFQPQTIWLSQSGDFQNNRPDSWVQGATAIQDTNAINVTLASGTSAPIHWLAGIRSLLVGTAIGNWVCASRGAALTPSDFSAIPQTAVKALDAAPVPIDSGAIFIQRAKRAVYNLIYAQQLDGLKASDITILSDHIGKGNFAQLAYQAEPISTLWHRLEDGTLAALTYQRDQNVIGWTPCTMGGTIRGAALVESIAVIPGNNDPGQVYSSVNRDEVWMIVNRNVNGITKRYIEMFEGAFDGPNRAGYTNKATWRAAVVAAQVDAFYVDCGLTYVGVPTTTISNLGHLEGETVKVVADGAVQQDKVVVGGTITLDLAASKVHVGLSYPWVYRGLKLPYGSRTGTGIGQTKNINGIVFVVRDAASFDYCIDMAGEGDEEAGDLVFSSVPFRKPTDPMSAAYPLFSGEVQVDEATGNGFSTDPRVVLQGTAPMPFTLLGVAPRIDETEL